jgi:hypothetical protein
VKKRQADIGTRRYGPQGEPRSVIEPLSCVGTAGFEPAPLDPQNGAVALIAAQGVISVHAVRSPARCHVHSVGGVWSPKGPRPPRSPVDPPGLRFLRDLLTAYCQLPWLCPFTPPFRDFRLGTVKVLPTAAPFDGSGDADSVEAGGADDRVGQSMARPTARTIPTPVWHKVRPCI